MRKMLLFLLLLPCLCHAQVEKWDMLEHDYIDDATSDTIKRTYWQVLEYASLSRHLTTFYRLSSVNSEYFLELKVMESGYPFIVVQDAPFKIRLDFGIVVTLHNEHYTKSTLDGAARNGWGANAQGATLLFKIDQFDLAMLMNYYVQRIRLYCGDGYIQREVSEKHSELFMDELYLLYNANNPVKKVRHVL